MVQRRYLLALLLPVLVLAIFLPVTINENIEQSEERAIKNLEAMNFTLYEIDILSVTEDTMEIYGVVNISNLDNTSSSIEITINNLNLNFHNETHDLVEFDIPIPEDTFGSQNEQKNVSFTINYALNDLTSSRGIGTLLSKFMSMGNSYVDFTGKIEYEVYGFTRSIVFDNILQIALLDTYKLNYKAESIEFTREDGKETIINLSVFNPFSIDLMINGFLSLFIEEYFVGIVDVDEEIMLTKVWTNYSLFGDFQDLPTIAIPRIFDTYQSQFNFIAELEISISSYQFQLITPGVLTTTPSDNAFDVSINQVNNLSIATDTGSIHALIDLNITHFLPFTLNVSSLVMNFTSLSGRYLGQADWESTAVIPLLFNTTATLDNISLSFKDLSYLTMLEISSDLAILISDAEIRFQFFTTEIVLTLEDFIIDLSNYLEIE
ncbi:MAG: hypothetical protein INQ03_01710 [Candidatus Heimdallarchaeota archaeon]|nr:hypothetical protein [Candidatus Heimdallarchaeota archaeon]